VKGELPQSKREQFKTYFLTSPSRRSKLEFAKALATVSLDSNSPAPCEWREVLAKAPPAFSREALSRVDHSLWRPTPFEGVDAKILSANQVTGSVTSILRMRAGSRYPAHRHATDEHTFVLEGDANFGDRILYAGDYQVAKGDTSHQAVTTIAGCMVLVMSNVGDQVLG
jgi:quercetin dioxygenase-like cupin family protein